MSTGRSTYPGWPGGEQTLSAVSSRHSAVLLSNRETFKLSRASASAKAGLGLGGVRTESRRRRDYVADAVDTFATDRGKKQRIGTRIFTSC